MRSLTNISSGEEIVVDGSYSPFIFKVSGEAFEPGWLCHKWHCRLRTKQ